MKRAAPLLIGMLIGVTPALAADPPCGVVEVRFAPGAKNLQIVVWIEDTAGNVLATPYITRTTGQFGIANRPGNPLLKSGFGWPYGRRQMVAPVWAHRRNHHYPLVVMGGACGNNIYGSCPNKTCVMSACDVTYDGEQGSPCCCGDCNEDTIAYHGTVSSTETFFCAPNTTPDVTSCASKFRTLSKGAYTTDGSFSLYPPRADLTGFNAAVDSPDVKDFKKQNDLLAVSAATPKANLPLSPPIDWCPGTLVAGDYVAWIEISQEYDFNASHNHPNEIDAQPNWTAEGTPFLGQPSVVWKIPFHIDGTGQSAITNSYAGYGDWDGATGTLHPPDGTITTNVNGSGAGRLIDVMEGGDVYRAKVVVGNCGGSLPVGGMCGGGGPLHCSAPEPVEDLALTPNQSTIEISFGSSLNGIAANRFSIRYRAGSTPIGDDEFDTLPAAPSAVGDPGETITALLEHLDPASTYTIGVRAVAPCGATSTVVSATTQTTKPQFATLHGCFIATAAYGSSLEQHVARLRAFRDRHLLTNPAGQLATAIYYAFSPPLAGVIGANQGLRALARRALEPIAGLVR